MWHAIGTIFVLFAFPFALSLPIKIDSIQEKGGSAFYYSGFYVLFYIGYTMAQTAHLAMIPELCHTAEKRSSLIVIRNSMTAFSNILGYGIALLFFSLGK